MPLPQALAAINHAGQFVSWHGTVSKDVPYWFFPRTPAEIGAVLELCRTDGLKLGIAGSSWSLSDILRPDQVMLELGSMQPPGGVAPLRPVAPNHCAQPAPAPHAYFHVLANTLVRSINDGLGKQGYALRTSGAANGQTIAGVIGTGSHGAALHFGAVHDAVRAVCVIVAPGQALVVQAATATLTDAFATALGQELGMQVALVSDDDAFGAAVVGLGTVGVVYSVVLEVEPLYKLRSTWVDAPLGDEKVMDAIRADNPESLVNAAPYHAQFGFNPYAENTVGIWGNFFEKVALAATDHYTGPSITHLRLGSAFTFWAAMQSANLRELFPFTVNWIAQQHFHDAMPKEGTAVFPGDAFGDTTLVKGMGRGMEIAVRREYAFETLEILLSTLQAMALNGKRMPGALGMRYVGRSTTATLAVNSAAPENTSKGIACFELGALVRPNDKDAHAAISEIFTECITQLRKKVIFTLHWGMENGLLTPDDLRQYYTKNVNRWKLGREKVVPAAMRDVFRNPMTDRLELT